MSTRPANEIAIARARHISPFGNPIKEHNPCLSVRCSNFFLPFFFFLPPDPTIRPSPNFRGNLIFRKNAPPSIYPSRRSAAIFESAESAARSPHFLFLDPVLPVVYFSSLGFSSIVSLLSWFSANNFDSRARGAAPPVVRHSTIFLGEYVTRRFSADGKSTPPRPDRYLQAAVTTLFGSVVLHMMRTNCDSNVTEFTDTDLLTGILKRTCLHFPLSHRRIQTRIQWKL